MKTYRVHLGYTPITFRARYRRFATLQEARDYCELYFRRRGVVLSIEECKS